MLSARIPTVKLKIPGRALLKSESRTSVTFKLVFDISYLSVAAVGTKASPLP